MDELQAKLAELDRQLIHQKEAATLSQKAAVLTKLEQYDEALVCVNQALDLRTDYAFDWVLKGFLCNELKNGEGAIASLQSALKLRPNNCQRWMSLGQLHYALDQYEKASLAYEKAVQYADAETDLSRIWALQMPAYFYCKAYQKRLDTLDNLIDRRPDQPHLFYNQACCYARLGRIEPGISALAKALSQDKTTLRQNAQEDEDLDALRSHSDFSALIKNKPND